MIFVGYLLLLEITQELLKKTAAFSSPEKTTLTAVGKPTSKFLILPEMLYVSFAKGP